ncbi:MAG: DUF1559 domain-containing protein, partial [Planctomycetia bacterium]
MRAVGESTHRRGYTILDVLVTISIVGLLISLLAPALGVAKGAARRMQCLSNIRQIGGAFGVRAVERPFLPASGRFSAFSADEFHGWPLEILPYIDQTALWEEWNIDRPHDDPVSRNRELAMRSIPLLACPSDASVVNGVGNLSYVVNGGFGWMYPVDCPIVYHTTGGPTRAEPFDFDGDGTACAVGVAYLNGSDRGYYFSTGLFFNDNWPKGSSNIRHHTLDTITDGLSKTIMLSENVRAGFDPQWNSNWAWPLGRRNCFFVSGYVCEDSTCAPGKVFPGRANDQHQGPYADEAINGSLRQAEG